MFQISYQYVLWIRRYNAITSMWFCTQFSNICWRQHLITWHKQKQMTSYCLPDHVCYLCQVSSLYLLWFENTVGGHFVPPPSLPKVSKSLVWIGLNVELHQKLFLKRTDSFSSAIWYPKRLEQSKEYISQYYVRSKCNFFWNLYRETNCNRIFFCGKPFFTCY